MNYKKLLLVGFGVVFTGIATNVMADGLSLTSTGVTSPIQVSCNGIPLPSSYEMQPNSAINSIPWWAISAVFSSAQTLNCTFTLDNKAKDPVGSAQLNLNVLADEAKASNVTYSPAYNVTVSPEQNVFEQGITVAISAK